jgi:hypothetical protein
MTKLKTNIDKAEYIFNIDRRTLRKLIKQKHFPAKLSGNDIEIDIPKSREWVKKNKLIYNMARGDLVKTEKIPDFIEKYVRPYVADSAEIIAPKLLPYKTDEEIKKQLKIEIQRIFDDLLGNDSAEAG